MNGYCGKILQIDVSNGETAVLKPSLSVYRANIGGKGLAGYYLKPHATLPASHPLMPLIFMTGPLVGTASPTSGRMCVMSRSPLTGTIADASVGGKLGHQFKKAGWDGLIIQGKRSGLCGIHISDGEITINDASHLRGLSVGETFRQLPAKGAGAVIGPAAENGVRFASIAVNAHSLAGRGGLGLVMAEKGVKYIHIHGSRSVCVHDSQLLKKAREDINRLAASSPVLMGAMGISQRGTATLLDLINQRRMLPSGNFQNTHIPFAARVNAYSLNRMYRSQKTGCAGCRILCKKKAEDGRPLPEYESLAHFSALVGNTSPERIIEANKICNETGMDSISAAATLACYAEIKGLSLNSQRLLNLLSEMAGGRGEGRQLGMGSRSLAEGLGRPDTSMTVKGLELPAYDPRGAYGMALAYATSTRGGCHLRAYPISHEILRKPVSTDRFSFSGKARIIKLAEDMNAVVDSLTACKFMFFAASLEEYAAAYQAVTGLETSAQDLYMAGEYIYDRERRMNNENGFTAEDDMLPKRFFTETGSSGDGIAVPPIPGAQFKEALQNYYKIRNLDAFGKEKRHLRKMRYNT